MIQVLVIFNSMVGQILKASNRQTWKAEQVEIHEAIINIQVRETSCTNMEQAGLGVRKMEPSLKKGHGTEPLND